MGSILFEIENNMAIITLNRSEKFNSFNREMALLFQTHLDTCATEKKIRAILITAVGKAFCAGQDLSEAIEDNGISLEQIVREHYNPIIKKIRTIQKPIVCAVNGVAAGAGANIALACDIVLANEQATFIQAFSKIGLIPDSGGTYFLPRLIGLQKATALMMLGEKVSARDAESMGMIYKVFSAETYMTEAKKITTTLSQMPTIGLGLTKKLLQESYENDITTQLQRELEEQVVAGNTHDFNEGVQSFLEKRSPVFKGE